MCMYLNFLPLYFIQVHLHLPVNDIQCECGVFCLNRVRLLIADVMDDTLWFWRHHFDATSIVAAVPVLGLSHGDTKWLYCCMCLCSVGPSLCLHKKLKLTLQSILMGDSHCLNFCSTQLYQYNCCFCASFHGFALVLCHSDLFLRGFKKEIHQNNQIYKLNPCHNKMSSKMLPTYSSDRKRWSRSNVLTLKVNKHQRSLRFSWSRW